MTEPQHMTALAKANVTHLARAALHDQVRDAQNFEASCWELAEILAAGVPECMRGMRVEQALGWVRRPRPSLAGFVNGVLDVVGCTEWKKLGDLSVRQRSVLVRELRWVSVENRMAA